ncbi:SUKH-4 family immunity protein [Hymenobacter sp. UYP22]|uniref:SUKH-4 family immunity protein n=1 Tax=Hymenobacter sp. UYP22 TaxID=3156348 RepID=UPI00339783C4
MTIAEIKEYWAAQGQSTSTFTSVQLPDADLSSSTRQFLEEAGLPIDAAPFLSFANQDDPPYLISTQYDFLPASFERYVCIGSDGAGNPIVIDSLTQQILLLDHENEFAIQYMNSTIWQLAEALIVYCEFGKQTVALNGKDAFIDANFSDELFTDLRQKLFTIDSVAINDNSFWVGEMQNLLANREYYQTESGT